MSLILAPIHVYGKQNHLYAPRYPDSKPTYYATLGTKKATEAQKAGGVPATPANCRAYPWLIPYPAGDSMPKPPVQVEAAYHGVTKTLPLREWAALTGISQAVLYRRIYYSKWSPEKAINTPVNPHKSKPERSRRLEDKGSSEDKGYEKPRQANPLALEAYVRLHEEASDKDKKSSERFLEAYRLLFEHGPMTGEELDEKGREIGLPYKLHPFLTPLREFGLVGKVGRRKSTHMPDGNPHNVNDVTNKIPTKLVTWGKAHSLEGKEHWKRNQRGHSSNARQPREDATLADVAWLKIAAREFAAMLNHQDRLGRHYSPACRKAVAFLEEEARRCEHAPPVLLALQTGT